MKTVIVVPRDMVPAYYFFMRATAETNGMALVIDRRLEARRLRERRSRVETGSDRRISDRRGPPPISWTHDGFLRVRDEGEEPVPRRTYDVAPDTRFLMIK